MTTSVPTLAIDIGGTKLAAAIIRPDNTVILRRERPTLAMAGAAAVLARVIELAQTVLAAGSQTDPAQAPAAVGVASAGQIDPETGNVVEATDNLPGWRGLALGSRLAEALGLPVYVENDVNAFALAEAALGAGRGYQHLLLVAVGTGIGGGVIVDGQLYSGRLGRAGEVGHLILVPEGGRPCTCGLNGCLESYAAARIMVAEAGFASIQDLARHYRTGKVVPAVDAGALWLGRGLASLAHILGPQALVIGGSVGLLGERYLAQVRQSFTDHVRPVYRDTPLLPAALGADSGLLGAAVLARQELGK